jgi:hypothetical protein
VLLSKERQILLNCCRQAGKSTVVSALAQRTALFAPKSTAVIRLFGTWTFARGAPATSDGQL